MTFRVRWEIDVEQENVTTELQAARWVARRYLKVGTGPSDACVFDVAEHGPIGTLGPFTSIDLSDYSGRVR